MTIRSAEPGEAAAIHDVVDAAYRHYVARIGCEPGPMLDDYSRRITDGEAWVLEANGQIVGILVLEERSDAFILDNIAVLPACQGRSYGRALLDFAESEARRRGWTAIQLYTHALMTENQALYRRIGYVETRRVHEKGFDRVYMTKPLL